MSDWTPAFEGQRPPFERGHDVSLRHGARSERAMRLIAETAERLRRELQSSPDDLTPSATVIHQLAQADALAEMYFAALVDSLERGERGAAWRSKEFRQYVRLGLELRREAGLTVRARVERWRALAGGAPPAAAELVASLAAEADAS